MPRFWDALPRVAALIACGLMLWPLTEDMVKHLRQSTPSPTKPPVGKPAQTEYIVTHSALQADPSAAYWAITATIQGRQTSPFPYPRLLAIVQDAAGTEIFRVSLSGDHDSTGPDADGMRTWLLRSEHPRTLAAERYHTLTTSLVSEP